VTEEHDRPLLRSDLGRFGERLEMIIRADAEKTRAHIDAGAERLLADLKVVTDACVALDETLDRAIAQSDIVHGEIAKRLGLRSSRSS